jgi:hypothetical protein
MLGLIATVLIVYLCWPGIHWLIGTAGGLAGLLVRLCHRVSAHAEVVVVVTTVQKAASNICYITLHTLLCGTRSLMASNICIVTSTLW